MQAFLLVLSGTTSNVLCQNAENRSPIPPVPSERCIESENVCEQLFKLRVAHEKKEHEELVSRAEEALKISKELEVSIALKPRLGESELDKLQSLEKLLKKIRSELGARDSNSGDKEDDNDVLNDDLSEKPPADVVSGFKILRESTMKLVDEIRKSTRFTISAAAISTSNTILKLTRILRFWR